MKIPVKKKVILNTIMVIAIVAIFAAGLLTVGNIQGWFGGRDTVQIPQADGTVKTIVVTTKNKSGSVNIERSGVAYSLEDGVKLRDGDIVQTLNGSTIDIDFGENTVSLDENSSVKVCISETGQVSMDFTNGGVFADIFEPFIMRLKDTEISLDSGVFSASAPYGSGSVYVFENTAIIGDQRVTEGNAASILQDGIHTAALSIQSLNSFDLTHVVAANQNRSLCFTNTQIEQLAAEREAIKREMLQAQLLEDESIQKVERQRQENIKKQEEMVTGDKTAGDENSGGSKVSSDENSGGSKASGDDHISGSKVSSDDDSGGNDGLTSPTCTITIRCDTILDNMDDLTEGKNKYVPANGTILASSKIRFEEGETVFDVLKRACSLAGIQLEYSWTPMYNSYYIEGINHLYEFDCGEESGWMYKVNDWFPNYGCSAYKLKDGDIIVWCYTCKGLGADVGGSVY